MPEGAGTELIIRPAYDPTFTFERFVRYCQNRNMQNRDTVVCITGYEGEGKSIVAQVLAHAFDPPVHLTDAVLDGMRKASIDEDTISRLVERYGIGGVVRPGYSVHDTVFYNWEDGIARMRDPTYYTAVNWDEAIEALFAAGRTREQTEIVKEFGKCRQYRHFIILCIPNLHWLDKYLREHRIVWWLHIVRRGVVDVHLAVRAKADVRPTYYHISTWQMPWDDAMVEFDERQYKPAKETAKIAYDGVGKRRKKS